jgi:hypothetical protein
MAQRENQGPQPPAKSVPTSSGYLIAREPGGPLKMGKQKTASRAGALIDDAKKWKAVDWATIRRQVRRLQVRIAKAVKENRWNRARALQYLLTRSLYAKLLAVKRVTSNKGKKTPGVDGVLWRGARAKWRAACSLRRRGYRRDLRSSGKPSVSMAGCYTSRHQKRESSPSSGRWER